VQAVIWPKLKKRKELRTRLFGWWYLMIAAGFALLALNGCLVAAPVSRIVTHCVVAGVFLVIGVMTLRPRKQ